MLEKDIEKYLRQRIESIGGLCLKLTSPSMNGLPDRLVIIPGGRIVFVELKAPGQKLRPLQVRALRRLYNLKAEAYVIDNKKDIDYFIYNITHNTPHA